MFGYLKISQDISGYLRISLWGELPDGVGLACALGQQSGDHLGAGAGEEGGDGVTAAIARLRRATGEEKLVELRPGGDEGQQRGKRVRTIGRALDGQCERRSEHGDGLCQGGGRRGPLRQPF